MCGCPLPTVYDVPVDTFITRLALELKEGVEAVRPPPWSDYVKTGVHAERQPNSEDWWYVRAASILRKLYVKGPMGVSRMSQAYGGRTGGRSAPGHARSGSSNIVRKILQQLETAGLVAKVDKRGRTLTDKGRSLLDQVATDLKKSMDKRAMAQG